MTHITEHFPYLCERSPQGSSYTAGAIYYISDTQWERNRELKNYFAKIVGDPNLKSVFVSKETDEEFSVKEVSLGGVTESQIYKLISYYESHSGERVENL